MQSEDKKSIGGIKAMRTKDWVPGYVCANAGGFDKLPMAIIEKPKISNCFRLGMRPVPYFSEQNAWSNFVTFGKWFTDVFLTHIRKNTSKDVILLMHNCGPHGSDLIDHREQRRIVTLPPNCTSYCQPMHMGIISAWKQKYRSLLLRLVVKRIDTCG